MRTTLFYIPHEFGGLTVFGLGWLLIGWILFSVGLLVVVSRKKPDTAGKEIAGYLPVLVIVGLAICFLLPMVEVTDSDGNPLGLPIRGYGLMVLLGVVAGVTLSAYQARRMGIHPEVILSLAFWFFVAGIVGARLFFIIEYWNQSFKSENFVDTLKAMFSVTEGGLVVYGALFGAVIAGFVFCRRRKLPVLAMADIVAPGMMLGLALGRIGCLMNGCCFGGVCHEDSFAYPVAVTFPSADPPYIPNNSPPYQRQLDEGQLEGIVIGDRDSAAEATPVITSVHPSLTKGDAGGPGLRVGDVVTSINGERVTTIREARRALFLAGDRATIVTRDGRQAVWSLPERSLPVHPTQIYSSISAALLCFFLWTLYPFRQRDGVVFAAMLTIYPLIRYLLEVIRVDEPAQFGSADTSISQWVSGVLLVAIVGLWIYILRQPAGTALPALPAAGAKSQK